MDTHPDRLAEAAFVSVLHHEVLLFLLLDLGTKFSYTLLQTSWWISPVVLVFASLAEMQKNHLISSGLSRCPVCKTHSGSSVEYFKPSKHCCVTIIIAPHCLFSLVPSAQWEDRVLWSLKTQPLTHCHGQKRGSWSEWKLLPEAGNLEAGIAGEVLRYNQSSWSIFSYWEKQSSKTIGQRAVRTCEHRGASCKGLLGESLVQGAVFVKQSGCHPGPGFRAQGLHAGGVLPAGGRVWPPGDPEKPALFSSFLSPIFSFSLSFFFLIFHLSLDNYFITLSHALGTLNSHIDKVRSQKLDFYKFGQRWPPHPLNSSVFLHFKIKRQQ